MKTFEGKVALVTGAASGLGRALCLAAAAEGATVIAVDINGDGAGETAAAIEEQGFSCTARQADVSSRQDMESLAASVLSEFGHVDILVGTAGVGVGGRVEMLKLEDWELAVGVNLWGNIHGVHYFLPRMIERGEGHIVAVSSIGGLVPLPGNCPYATAKFALVGMFESLRFDLAKYGIGVTTVCPGAMRTGFFEHLKVRADERDQKMIRYMRWIWERLSMAPDRAAGKVMEGIKRNRPLLLIGKEAHVAYTIRRLFPRSYSRALEFLTKNVM